MALEFPCDQCGACCRVGPMIHDELKAFDRGDGACVHLKEDNTCAIYENRPDICNTRIMYKEKYSDQMTWEQYCALGEEGCNELKDLFDGT